MQEMLYFCVVSGNFFCRKRCIFVLCMGTSYAENAVFLCCVWELLMQEMLYFCVVSGNFFCRKCCIFVLCLGTSYAGNAVFSSSSSSSCFKFVVIEELQLLLLN